MTDATGNVLHVPSNSGPSVATTDREILATYVNLTQKGVTLLHVDSTVYEAGTVMKVSATPKKYDNCLKANSLNLSTNEVNTLTEGGSGLTSFTLTVGGQTTASIDDDATAAEVQAALEATSYVAPGDVYVTGGPLGTGPFTVTWGGELADTDITMTSTPTGGTGTVTVGTTTAGGGVGTPTEFPIGILRKQVDVGTTDMEADIVFAGQVKGSEIRFTDWPYELTTKELKDLAAVLGGRYEVIHGFLIF